MPKKNQRQLLTKNLKKNLSESGKVVVVGIGSSLRSDDVAGILVVEYLKKKINKEGIKNIIAIDAGTAPENFTGEIISHNPTDIIFVDAAELGLVPGKFAIIPKDSISGVSFSTHSLPLSILINYLENSIKCKVHVIGIQPQRLKFDYPPTDTIKEAARELAKELID